MWDGVNRRKFPRAEYPCLIVLRKNIPPIQAVLAHTVDISVGGISVMAGKKIEVLTEVDLEIDLKDTLPNVTTTGRVSWLKEIAPQQKGRPLRYEIGIRFISLSDETRRRIQSIVSHLAHKERAQ